MENRRNYYRILEVQPDAGFDVIRQNYRLLLRRLRLHPDLGGSSRDAALLNEAYEVLSSPEKRAEYDVRLLERYKISVLSQGPLLKPRILPGKIGRVPSSLLGAPGENRRNYYRVLGVQPDAHAEIIRRRCTELFENSELPRELIQESYLVLNSPAKRAEYDRLLKLFGHSEAVRIMKDRIRPEKGTEEFQVYPYFPDSLYTIHPMKSIFNSPELRAREKPEKGGTGNFEPLIRRYCSFCKTPHNFDPVYEGCRFCPVCGSPLFAFMGDMSGEKGRAVSRMRKRAAVVFYVYWPGRGLRGELLDWSPRGMSFKSEYGLDEGQTIKIDAHKFRAVGEVVHSRQGKNEAVAGVYFLAVAFSSQSANFFDKVV